MSSWKRPLQSHQSSVISHADGSREMQEAIQVAIRLRPLNRNEAALGTVWKVLPKHSSIAQTTKEGKPMPEIVQGKNFFTYDKVFGESSSTQDIYDSVVKNIVGAACNGLNGTIFAYGQTSSGKTFTMQGSGTIEEGSQGAGGIVHMAANQIFDHISKHDGRLFAVRASFLEIYNEEVRDLLSTDSRALQIREDPAKGAFVEAEEKPVHDFATLLTILFEGDKSRKIAQTAMNERSSRSHTIFRITIESKVATIDDSSGADGAIQVSTLNLVDLAGSESVRHTGATGDRQVEGGMINRSLLALSRVIASLGNQGQTHINFRDSKLTRLLQPSLSGNARMAVICCATPSRLYLEETRSTLAFASRAKLVKTNAQVNEVVSDQTQIRRLKRENAVLKLALAGTTIQHGDTHESLPAAKKKLKRVAGALLQAGPDIFNNAAPASVKRRRHSYGFEPRQSHLFTPPLSSTADLPRTECRVGVDLGHKAKLLFREVISNKSKVIREQNRRLDAKESELLASKCANDILVAERSDDQQTKSTLLHELQEIKSQLVETMSELRDVSTSLEKEQLDRKIIEDERARLIDQVSESETSTPGRSGCIDSCSCVGECRSAAGCLPRDLLYGAEAEVVVRIT